MPMALSDRAIRRAEARSAKRWEDLERKLCALPTPETCSRLSAAALERKFRASINERIFRCDVPAQTPAEALVRLSDALGGPVEGLKPLFAIAFLLEHAPAIWRKLSTDERITPSPAQFGRVLDDVLDALTQLRVDILALAQRQALGEADGSDIAEHIQTHPRACEPPALRKVASRWLPDDTPPALRQAVQRMQPSEFRKEP